MEQINRNNIVYASCLFLPLTFLIINYIASKIGTQTHLFGDTLILFVLISISIVFVRHNSFFSWNRDTKALLWYTMLSIVSNIFTVNYFEEYYTIITTSILPIVALIVGKTFGNILNNSIHPNRLITIILIPFFVASLLLMKAMYYISIFQDGRDAVFCVIIFLPLILIYRNKLIHLTLFLVITYISFISGKKTAILCVSITMLYYVISNVLNKNVKIKKRLPLITIIGCLMYGCYMIAPKLQEQFSFTFDRLEEVEEKGDESRIYIYTKMISEMEHADVTQLLFGHGSNAVTKNIFGHPAHNDLLEIMYDYGVIPLVFYVSFLLIVFYSYIIRRNHIAIFAFSLFLILTLMNCMITNPLFVFINYFNLGLISVCNLTYNKNDSQLSKSSAIR